MLPSGRSSPCRRSSAERSKFGPDSRRARYGGVGAGHPSVGYARISPPMPPTVLRHGGRVSEPPAFGPDDRHVHPATVPADLPERRIPGCP